MAAGYMASWADVIEVETAAYRAYHNCLSEPISEESGSAMDSETLIRQRRENKCRMLAKNILDAPKKANFFPPSCMLQKTSLFGKGQCLKFIWQDALSALPNKSNTSLHSNQVLSTWSRDDGTTARSDYPHLHCNITFERLSFHPAIIHAAVFCMKIGTATPGATAAIVLKIISWSFDTLALHVLTGCMCTLIHSD